VFDLVLIALEHEMIFVRIFTKKKHWKPRRTFLVLIFWKHL